MNNASTLRSGGGRDKNGENTLGRIASNGTKLQACVNDQAHFSVYGIAESGVNSFDISLTVHAQVQGVDGQGCRRRASFPQVCPTDSASISLANKALLRH